MKVFHAGYDEIRVPDIHRGRTNADFGQGFYLSDSYEFASRWVREKSGASIHMSLMRTGLRSKLLTGIESGSPMFFPTEDQCLTFFPEQT